MSVLKNTFKPFNITYPLYTTLNVKDALNKLKWLKLFNFDS